MEANVDRKQAGRLRAERSAEAGAGAARLQSFTAQFRSQPVMRDGKSLIQLDGYASTTNKPYDMWDIFGPYKEQVDSGAFDETLAAKPDVAYLVNHKGVTMARTTNGTLELEADFLGLRTRAYVNPARQDVRDILTAIEDKNITEMSFAFMIEPDGAQWNDDFTECTLTHLDLDRGDVSAVNYGANPFTSVAARSGEILRDLAKLPAGAQRAAYERLDKSLRAAGPDATPTNLMQAVDAAIDEAIALVAGIDPATLPTEVGQAIALLYAADSACDEMMDATGTYDADDDDAEDAANQDGAYMGRAGEPAEKRADTGSTEDAAAGKAAGDKEELSQVERLTRDLNDAPRGSDIRLIEQLLELS